MRRPLPSGLGTKGTPAGSTPDQTPTPTPVPCGGTSQDPCVTPTPTPDPANTGAIPTSSTQPGATYDPTLDEPVSNAPSSAVGVASYVVGQWSGSGQCGQQATFTRTVSCVVDGPAGGGFPAQSMVQPRPGMTPGVDARVMDASYAAGTDGALLSSAVYDPSSSDVKAVLAQFSPGQGGAMKRTTMPIQYCIDNGAGQPPANTYSGTQGGCEYHAQDDGGSGWQLPDGASGTATCSAQAYKVPNYSCYDQTGAKVDIGYCVENVQSGGDRNSYLVDPQYGNFSNCKTGWVGYPTDNYCFQPTAVPGYFQPGETAVYGPDHNAYFTYKCMRSDGTELTGPDAAACTDPQPSDGWRVVGSCSKTYYAGSGNAHCQLGDNDEYLVGVIAQSADTSDPHTGGSNFCVSTNAACCGTRIASNYDENDGQYEIVASKLPPVPGLGYYFDEVNKRKDSTQEGVLSLWYGASAGTYETDSGVSIEDPNGVLLNGGGPVGGGPIN